MPMIESDTFKSELEAANLAREALIDHLHPNQAHR